MAVTLKALIRKGKMRADKTWNVLIRLTYDRRVKYIATNEFVEKKDITASGRIKNMAVVERCEDLIRVYRKRIGELNLEVNDMDIDDVVRYVTMKRNAGGLSFTGYAEKWLEESEAKGKKNYRSAVNALKRFVGREEIMFDEVTVNLMRGFEKWLGDKPRAASLYCSAIVKMFNDAREYYNDEDNDVVLIKHSLRKYRVPKPGVAEKRALPVEVVRRIFSLSYDGKKVKGMCSVHDLALDCYRLSFCLMGMNSADLWAAEDYEDGMIVYHRAKTKDRRSDGAEMRVVVPDVVRDVFERWRDADGERVFSFHYRFSTPENLNKSINEGLKAVGREVGVEGLQFYSARHSMATIALNEAGISKWLVNDMLCHVDPAMKVTELYIKKDYRPINEANERLMMYVFPEEGK